jgi:hypothetical protein
LPGHTGIDGNETADQLTKEGSPYPLIGPKSALGISAKVAKEVIRDWKHGCPSMDKGKLKAFLKNTLQKKAGELLSLSRNQVKNNNRL